MVITDGRSLDDVHSVSKRLRARGITIFSVGVGRYFNARELDSMATDPDKTHVFTSDFKQLQYITNDLKKSICLSKNSALLLPWIPSVSSRHGNGNENATKQCFFYEQYNHCTCVIILCVQFFEIYDTNLNPSLPFLLPDGSATL